MTKLDGYFSPKKNVDYEVFQFRQAVQKVSETVDQFATRLRKLAAHCEFSNLERELKSAIIQNCHSKCLRRFALREEALTLDGLLTKARALEASETQASGIEKSLLPENVNRLHQDQGRTPPKPKPRPKTYSPNKCRNCGSAWPHKDGLCPTKGRTRRKCGKPNHFAKVCFTPQNKRQNPRQTRAHQPHPTAKSSVRQISQDQSSPRSDDEYLYTLDQDSMTNSKTPLVNVEVNGVPIEMIVDTGALTDILDEDSFTKINQCQTIELQPPTKRIFAYGSQSQLTVLGKFDVAVEFENNCTTSTIHVLQGNHGSLLSYKTASDLRVIDVRIKQVDHTPLAYKQLVQQYPNLFKGIGKLKNVEVKLHIDRTISLVAQPARRIPFHMRKCVAAELDSLERQGIIEKVDGPTPWISPLVIIPKKNRDVRVCVDMRMANKAINRERHPSPTVDDLIHTLNGATVFSKLDLCSGYHQLSLAPESRYITTFATHKGLRRYTRLNFGTNSASEIFQNTINEQIRDIQGILNISDDVIVFAKTQDAHDKALQAVFQKLSDVSLMLNKSKCEFNKHSLTFFGFVFSAEGISPDPKKVQAIHNASPPTSTSGVRSFWEWQHIVLSLFRNLVMSLSPFAS